MQKFRHFITKFKRRTRKYLKRVFLTLSILYLCFLFIAMGSPKEPAFTKQFREIPVSNFIALAQKYTFQNITVVDGQYILGQGKSTKVYTVIPLGDYRIVNKLIDMRLNVKIQKSTPDNWVLQILIQSLIGMLVFLPTLYLSRPDIFHNKLFKKKLKSFYKSNVKLEDVAGIDEIKDELVEAVEYLKNPDKFKKLGIKAPRGILFYGDPGVGKTLLAKAIAGEAHASFIALSGSDFVELFVGTGASRIRQTFSAARENAPCIIFIDEIDAIGGKRGTGLIKNDEREQTLNQLLVEMDGFNEREGILVIAATNRVDVLDPALLRPGRFDRQIFVPKPDLKGRYEILKVHTRNKPLADDVDLMKIAKRTPGLVGAHLENIVNEAAMNAAKNRREFITMEDFEKAVDKVLMGLERKGSSMSAEEKRKVAVHETGHAFLSVMTESGHSLHKVSIIPRGMALGVTTQMPEEKYLYDKAHLISELHVLLAGRAAEEVFYGEDGITTGASDDLKRATELVYSMIAMWGMDKDVGLVSFVPFFSMAASGMQSRGVELPDEIYAKIKNILDEIYANTKSIIEQHKDVFAKIVDVLVANETLSCEEFIGILKENGITVKKECGASEQEII